MFVVDISTHVMAHVRSISDTWSCFEVPHKELLTFETGDIERKTSKFYHAEVSQGDIKRAPHGKTSFTLNRDKKKSD
jgi:hypothetical protein